MTGGIMVLVTLGYTKKNIPFAVSDNNLDVPLIIVVDKEAMLNVPSLISTTMRMSMTDDGDFIFYDEKGVKFQDFRNSIFIYDYYSFKSPGEQTLNEVKKFLDSDDVKFKFGFLFDTNERKNRVQHPLKNTHGKEKRWIESEIKDIFNNSYYDLQLLDITNIKKLKSKIINYDWFNLNEDELNYLKKIDYNKIPLNILPERTDNIIFQGEYLDGSKFYIDLKNSYDYEKWLENKEKFDSESNTRIIINEL